MEKSGLLPSARGLPGPRQTSVDSRSTAGQTEATAEDGVIHNILIRIAHQNLSLHRSVRRSRRGGRIERRGSGPFTLTVCAHFVVHVRARQHGAGAAGTRHSRR